MKTFAQLMEQIPDMHAKSSAEQQTKQQIEHDRRVSLRQHRRHVHGELARTASYENQKKERDIA